MGLEQGPERVFQFLICCFEKDCVSICRESQADPNQEHQSTSQEPLHLGSAIAAVFYLLDELYDS